MIADTWRRTLLEWEAVRHYYMPYALISGRTFRNPLIENLVPGIMLVKSVAVFDEGLDSHIDAALGGLPGSYRPVLDGRIRFLADQGLISNGSALHRVRQERNAIAHGGGQTTTWNQVAVAIDDMEAALIMLGLVNRRAKLEYFGERSAIEISTSPGILGTRTYTIGVREDGKAAFELRWDERLHRQSPNAAGLQ